MDRDRPEHASFGDQPWSSNVLIARDNTWPDVERLLLRFEDTLQGKRQPGSLVVNGRGKTYYRRSEELRASKYLFGFKQSVGLLTTPIN